MAEKKTVYLKNDDLVRLRLAREKLQQAYPMQSVSVAWVFRFALFALCKQLGLTNVESGPELGGEGYGPGR